MILSASIIFLLSAFFYSPKKVLNCILYTVLVTFSAVLVYPLLLVVFAPILLYRKLVATFVQKWDSKCGAILPGLDALLAAQDPYNKAFITVSPYFTFNDKLERSHIVKVLNEQIFVPNLFPNLKQRIVRKFGYYFWYPVDNFNVEHHVHYLNPNCPDEPVHMTTLRRLGSKRNGQLPFDPSKSPWELILVPNLINENNPSEKSAIYIRTNHCLMDGYSLASFTQKAAVNPWNIDVAKNALNNKQSSREANAVVKKLLIFLKMLVTGPYHFLHGALYLRDQNSFLKKALAPSSAIKQGLNYAIKELEPRKFDGARLRRVRKHHNVTGSSVLLTMVAEGIMRFIKRRWENGFCEKLPKTIHFHMSFPVPGHSGKMTNHWTTTRMVIPVNKDNDPTKTLQNVHEQYQIFKTSIVPLVNFVASQLMGCLPIPMLPDLGKISRHTIALTNFPGPTGKLDIFGYEWETLALSGNIPDGSVVCQNLHDKFWIDIGGVKSVFASQEDLLEVENDVLSVLSELENTMMSKINSGLAENHADNMNGN